MKRNPSLRARIPTWIDGKAGILTGTTTYYYILNIFYDSPFATEREEGTTK